MNINNALTLLTFFFSQVIPRYPLMILRRNQLNINTNKSSITTLNLKPKPIHLSCPQHHSKCTFWPQSELPYERKCLPRNERPSTVIHRALTNIPAIKVTADYNGLKQPIIETEKKQPITKLMGNVAA